MRQTLIQPDFDAWRSAARALLAGGVAPDAVTWAEAGVADATLPGLFESPSPAAAPAVATPVPRPFVDFARDAACFRDPARWGLLYRVLWRLARGGEPRLLDDVADDDVRRLLMMQKAVRRDRHKMTAFVRFRRTVRPTDAGADGPAGQDRPEWFVAWHRPDHLIVRSAAPFFVRRFRPMRWAILTPDASATWDGAALSFGPGVPAAAAPAADELEDLWRAYYASTFNPARANPRAMRRELPVRHWPTLPEADLIPDLLRDAPRRVEEMMATIRRNTSRKSTAPGRDKPAAGKARPDGPDPADPNKLACPAAKSAAEFLPATRDLSALRAAAKGCQGCGLYCNATQTVFGEGPAKATIMFVGEQPGDQEDLAGKPFVGPSGRLLNDALAQAGIPRDECYVTNAVKHFKFEPRGTRRIHAKPSAREVAACRPWLEAEIEAVKPTMIVCLGATAAQSLLGRDFRVTQHRGEVLTETGRAPWVLATVHPSSLLRIPDPSMRDQEIGRFVDDMKAVARQIRAEKRG